VCVCHCVCGVTTLSSVVLFVFARLERFISRDFISLKLKFPDTRLPEIDFVEVSRD